MAPACSAGRAWKRPSRMFFSRKLRRSSMTMMSLAEAGELERRAGHRPGSSCPCGGWGRGRSRPRSARTWSRYGPAMPVTMKPRGEGRRHGARARSGAGRRVWRETLLRSPAVFPSVPSCLCALMPASQIRLLPTRARPYGGGVAVGHFQFLLPGAGREQDLVQVDLRRCRGRFAAWC